MKTNTQKSKKTTDTKSKQLAALNVKKEAAWKALRASGEGLSTKGPLGRVWSKVNREVTDLEESFVVYRGQEIEAVTVAVQSGALTISPYRYFEDADERLYRTGDGIYYLWREEWQQKATVRKMTLEGALLWAVTRVNIQDTGLRDDVVALFKKGGAR